MCYNFEFDVYIILYDHLIMKYKTLSTVFTLKVQRNMEFIKFDYIYKFKKTDFGTCREAKESIKTSFRYFKDLGVNSYKWKGLSH